MNNKVTMIAITDMYHKIGYDNKSIFNYKEDLLRFKNLTQDNTVIMGRKTYESLPKSKLPGKLKHVLSFSHHNNSHDTIWFTSMKNALLEAPKDKQIFIIGGGQIFKDALTFYIPNEIDLTIVMATWITPIKDTSSARDKKLIKLPPIPLAYSVIKEYTNPKNPKLLHRQYTLNRDCIKHTFLEELRQE